MKRFLFLLSFTVAFFNLKSQCFEIQSILVDACDGPNEGKNEMVTFKVGSAALNSANMSVTWPNNSWLGLTQNASTAADVATVNATIIGCGLLKEPVAGVLPANAKVLLVTSTAWNPLAQSFVNLSDTLYVLFQTAGNTSGHFANYTSATSPSPFRTLSITFSSPSGCTDAVTYNRTQLINQSQVLGAQDGGAVDFTPSGTPTYVNKGCQAPFIPLSVNAGVDQVICVGATQNYTATISGAYTSVNWSLGAGATGTFAPTNSLTTTYTPGALENGTIKLYVTISKACGTATTTVKDSVLLTITPLPTLTLSPTNVAICSGQTTTVTASANTTVTYTWSTAANTNSVSLNSAGVYTCNVSNACGNASATVNVSLSASPTLSVAASSPSICANGQTITLNASGSSGTYLWSNGANTSSTSIISPGVYTATVTTPSCGTAVSSITVAAIPLPIVSISVPSSTMCTGSSLTFTANSSSGNYLWAGGATTQTVSVNTSSIVVTTTNVCGSAQATQTINVIPTPTITVDNANVNLCSGQSATITATSNATTYTWNPGSINTNSIALSTAGIYTVTTNNLCGNASATVSVSISSAPTLTIVSSAVTICSSGQTATLSLAGSTGPYSWSTGSNTSTTTISSPGVYSATVSTSGCGNAVANISLGTAPLPVVTITGSASPSICVGGNIILTANSNEGNYLWSNGATTNTVSVNSPSISVTSTNACGSSQATQTLNIVPLPTLTLSTNAISLCSGQSATVQSNANTSVTYTWSTGVNTSSVSLNSAGVFSCNISNACGNASESVTVTVGTLPSTTASATQTLLCSGQTTTLSTSGIGNYLWSNGATTQTTTVSNSGVYSVTLTNSCGSAVSSVSISSQVTPTVSISASSSTICAGQTSTITANSNVNNYLWSTGSFTNTTLVNTSGIVTVTVSNSCGVATSSTIVFSNTLPVLNLSSSSPTICPNETATLTVTGGSSPYSWSNTSNTGSVVTTNGGTITVSNTNSCGTVTAAVIVNVTNLNADVIANPTSGVLPLVVSFTNNSSNANSYAWNFGNGNSATTSTVSSETYSVAGTYTVYLIATNGSCSDIDSLIIEVLNQEGSLLIPNVFTPNGDSINDVFRVSGFNVLDFSCTIFDRWGLQMYSWDGIKNGWNGKSNDKEVPAGTYFYMINAKDIDSKEIKKQGAFSLFR